MVWADDPHNPVMQRVLARMCENADDREYEMSNAEFALRIQRARTRANAAVWPEESQIRTECTRLVEVMEKLRDSVNLVAFRGDETP